MNNTHRVTLKEKFSIMSRVRKNPNGPIHILGIILLSLPLLFISLLLAYRFTLAFIGDGAYKYSEDAYTQIKTAIKSCVLKDTGLDALNLQKQVSQFSFTYENNQLVLSCSIIDGFFEANVTCDVSENYSIMASRRNFNSLEDYMNYYWRTFGFYLFGIGFLILFIFSLFIFGGLYLYAVLANNLSQKKQKKSTSNISPADPVENSKPSLSAVQELAPPKGSGIDGASGTEAEKENIVQKEEKLPDAS